MERHPDIRVLGSNTLHRGRIFDLVRETLELPSGRRQEVEIVDHPGAVAIAAVDGDGRLVLVRQYRHAAGDWLEEIPAGRLERGEEPLEAARRELEEETGLCAESWRLLAAPYPAPGFCSERLHLFLAEGLRPAGLDRRTPDEDEELETVRRTPAEILRSGGRDMKTLLAAAWLARG